MFFLISSDLSCFVTLKRQEEKEAHDKMIVGGGLPMALVQLCIVYYVGCITVHYVVPRIAAPMMHLSEHKATSKQIAREAMTSFVIIVVKAFVFVAVEKLHDFQYGQLYDVQFGYEQLYWQIPSVLATILVLDYMHDAWFYFTHFLMHKWRYLYKHVHYLHHLSKVPTAFSGYSLHPIEGIIVFMDEIIVCFIFPIDIKVHRLYHLYTTLIHIGGHAGYEMHPLIPSLEQVVWILFKGSSVSKGLNTVLYHNIHHQFPNKHFSLYFTHWDEWMGTKSKAYDQETNQIKQQKQMALSKAKYSTLCHYIVLMVIMLGTLIICCSTYALSYHALFAIELGK